MAAYSALTRDLPHLHQSGAIKFRVVLSMARAERGFRRRLDAGTAVRSCLIRRLDRVRADMAPVRERIADWRAQWSIENVPTIEMRRVRVEAHGHVWHEAVPVAQADAALTAIAHERGAALADLLEQKAAA